MFTKRRSRREKLRAGAGRLRVAPRKPPTGLGPGPSPRGSENRGSQRTVVRLRVHVLIPLLIHGIRAVASSQLRSPDLSRFMIDVNSIACSPRGGPGGRNGEPEPDGSAFRPESRPSDWVLGLRRLDPRIGPEHAFSADWRSSATYSSSEGENAGLRFFTVVAAARLWKSRLLFSDLVCQGEQRAGTPLRRISAADTRCPKTELRGAGCALSPERILRSRLVVTPTLSGAIRYWSAETQSANHSPNSGWHTANVCQKSKLFGVDLLSLVCTMDRG